DNNKDDDNNKDNNNNDNNNNNNNNNNNDNKEKENKKTKKKRGYNEMRNENKSNEKTSDKKESATKRVRAVGPTSEDFQALMTVRRSLHPKFEMHKKHHHNVGTDDETKQKDVDKQAIDFVELYQLLAPRLLHGQWTVRHGSAIGLRALLTYVTGKCDAIFEQLSCVCIAALFLDRFCDFVSDA
ncbi:UPF0171 family protein, partial [Reticulomyxa filosa]